MSQYLNILLENVDIKQIKKKTKNKLLSFKKLNKYFKKKIKK